MREFQTRVVAAAAVTRRRRGYDGDDASPPRLRRRRCVVAAATRAGARDIDLTRPPTQEEVNHFQYYGENKQSHSTQDAVFQVKWPCQPLSLTKPGRGDARAFCEPRRLRLAITCRPTDGPRRGRGVGTTRPTEIAAPLAGAKLLVSTPQRSRLARQTMIVVGFIATMVKSMNTWPKPSRRFGRTAAARSPRRL